MRTVGPSKATSPSSSSCAAGRTASAPQPAGSGGSTCCIHCTCSWTACARSEALEGPSWLTSGETLLYSVRSLARTPALTATIVLTVGFGLGATTAMVGVVPAVLVNPLPYAAPDELFWIYTDNPPYRFRFSVVDYRALEADHPAFSAVAAYQTSNVTVTDGGAAERVTAKAVTGSYFPSVGPVGPHRPSLRRFRRYTRRPSGRADRGLLGAAIRKRSDGARPDDDHRRRELHGRRRPAEVGRSARAQRRLVHRRALADAQAQRPVLHDGDRRACAPTSRARRRSTRCARPTRGSSPSGSRPIRTRRPRGVWRI